MSTPPRTWSGPAISLRDRIPSAVGDARREDLLGLYMASWPHKGELRQRKSDSGEG